MRVTREPRCASCGAALLAEDRFCERCGARSPAVPAEVEPAAAAAAACHVCGTPRVSEDAEEYCRSCGVRIREQAERAELDLVLAAAVSDQGRSHRRNEDAFFLCAEPDRGAAAVVCDGVSSAAAGHLAARRAADAAGRVLSGAILGAPSSGHDAMLAAISAAHEASVFVPMTARSDRDAPSCTLVSALWQGGEITVGWLGDSRAYWLGAGAASQLTVDDSWASEQVELGLLSAEEAMRDEQAHAITRWVGVDAPGGAPNIVTRTPDGPGRLMLCTDGLWNYLSRIDELVELLAVLPERAAPVAIARVLSEVAMERGGRDDITVAVIDIDPNPERDIRHQTEGDPT